MKYTINNKPKLLKFDDIVIFNVKGKTYEYKVHYGYLYYLIGFPNDIIFTKLNLNKFNFCDKHYEYKCNVHNDDFWPECKIDDFEALTRVVNALYDEINKNILPDNLFTLE